MSDPYIGARMICGCGCDDEFVVVDKDISGHAYVVLFSNHGGPRIESRVGIDNISNCRRIGSVATGLSRDAMCAMSNALSFGLAHWDAACAAEVAGTTGLSSSDLACPSSSDPIVQQLRADLIRTKLAAIEAKRARPLGWDPEGQA